ncbi:MAG: hypothetical protein LIP01_08540 [Tannerellaceae bacterium]|nr:hypothetical protein [Tannerellaceae bacterium]
MHKRLVYTVRLFILFILIIIGTNKLIAQTVSHLYNQSLNEVKKRINGKWQLVSGETETIYFEFDDTLLNSKMMSMSGRMKMGTEGGNLNWRKQDTTGGEQVFLMDVFYDENPSYPFAIKGDTLYIQDATENAFLYKLVKRK